MGTADQLQLRGEQSDHTWRPTNTRMVNIFTEKASCCCSLTTAVNVSLLLSLLLRLAGLTCGCFYGPYLYLVVSIGGLYVAADCLLIWSLNRRTREGKFLCDFSSQKVWIFIWQVSNILAVIGLIVALGWYLASLGLWSMLYTPIHFAVFLIICFLLPSLLYSAYLLQTLYLVLGEAYIDFMLSRGREKDYYDDDMEEEEPFDFRRISV